MAFMVRWRCFGSSTFCLQMVSSTEQEKLNNAKNKTAARSDKLKPEKEFIGIIELGSQN